ncbi:MAG: hypothetical protein K8F91_22235, partial [Candidatus Obscuribacterales bacterium]|nr:hypothetical protein [Candidatus Obscuribacterales bacterium]
FQNNTRKITEPSGFVTRIWFSPDGPIGTREDPQGRIVDDVTLNNDFLTRTNRETGKVEQFYREREGVDHHHSRYVQGEIDQSKSVFFKHVFDGSNETISLDGSRSERISSDGQRSTTITVGRDPAGNLIQDHSRITAERVAEIERHDGSGLRMSPDFKIDIWNADKEITHKQLTASEIRYVEQHRDSFDLRDVAEIHRRFHDRPQELERFYKNLAKIDTSKYLSKQEITFLTGSIMHHVASPDEIYQGPTGNCTAAITQRNLAVNSPDLYAFTFAQVANNNQYETQDGKHTHIPMNLDNWKAIDRTGRDLGTRLFHNIAIQIETYGFDKRQVLVDDRGESYSIDPVSGEKESFRGLLPAHITDLNEKLTGIKHSVVA